MGKVDHAHDAEDQHQSDCEQGKKTTLDQAIDDRLNKEFQAFIPKASLL